MPTLWLFGRVKMNQNVTVDAQVKCITAYNDFTGWVFHCISCLMFSGNPGVVCGGGWRLNLYKRKEGKIFRAFCVKGTL